jgi:hypothetical protein
MQLSSLLFRPALLLTAAAALLLPGCAGYTTGSDKPGRMENVKSIAVPTFRNLTLEPRSAVLVTNNVVRQFQLDGTYQIKDAQDADAVLRGTIREFTRRQLRSARNNNLRTREMELLMIVDFVVEEPVTGNLLAKGTVQGSTSVFLDPNMQLSERQAIDDASRKMSEELVSRLSEGWGSAEFPEKDLKPDSLRNQPAPRSLLPSALR